MNFVTGIKHMQGEWVACFTDMNEMSSYIGYINLIKFYAVEEMDVQPHHQIILANDNDAGYNK